MRCLVPWPMLVQSGALNLADLRLHRSGKVTRPRRRNCTKSLLWQQTSAIKARRLLLVATGLAFAGIVIALVFVGNHDSRINVRTIEQGAIQAKTEISSAKKTDEVPRSESSPKPEICRKLQPGDAVDLATYAKGKIVLDFGGFIVADLPNICDGEIQKVLAEVRESRWVVTKQIPLSNIR